MNTVPLEMQLSAAATGELAELMLDQFVRGPLTADGRR